MIPRFARFTLIVLSAEFLFAPTGLGQRPEIVSLTNQLVESIAKGGKAQSQRIRASVLSFHTDKGKGSALGDKLSDEVSTVLAQHPEAFEVFGPSEIDATRAKAGWSWQEMQDIAVVTSVALQAGVRYFVEGNLLLKDSYLLVRVWVRDIQENKRIATAENRFVLDTDSVNLFNQLPLARDNAAELPGHSEAVALKTDNSDTPSEKRSSEPTCTSCPNPVIPKEFPKTASPGVILLRATIDENGKPIGLVVMKSSNKDLEGKAIEAVRSWRFRPAMKDGKLTKATILLEIEFTFTK